MENRPPQQGILTLTIKDKAALYVAYMPFIKNGGLFIPTNKPYHIGDEVFILLNLLDQAERLPISGKVVWITPQGAQNKRSAGIGVQFNLQDGGSIQKKIETYIAGMSNDRPTHTM